jgi:phospholipid/cholesterol/gamma-HCH transport system substrate-binding protein
MMLTRFIKNQLIIFLVLTVLALLGLGLYYLRLPSVAGVGQYQLKVDLPAAGGLYRTANVTYRGVTIGKVTGIEPTEKGAVATLRQQVQDSGRLQRQRALGDRGR